MFGLLSCKLLCPVVCVQQCEQHTDLRAERGMRLDQRDDIWSPLSSQTAEHNSRADKAALSPASLLIVTLNLFHTNKTQ